MGNYFIYIPYLFIYLYEENTFKNLNRKSESSPVILSHKEGYKPLWKNETDFIHWNKHKVSSETETK